MRTVVLAVTTVFLLAFFVATLWAAFDRGLTILSILSLLIIAMMGIGILGALWQQPPDDD